MRLCIALGLVVCLCICLGADEVHELGIIDAATILLPAEDSVIVLESLSERCTSYPCQQPQHCDTVRPSG